MSLEPRSPQDPRAPMDPRPGELRPGEARPGEERVYLDYNATAPVRKEAVRAMMQALSIHANPSSVHRQGRRARASVEGVRLQIAAIMGCRPEGVIFTSGGTEANNLALRGPVRSGSVNAVMISATEHDSILKPAEGMTVPVYRIPVRPNGVIDLYALRDKLKAWARDGLRPIVSVMHANNETGVIQPVREIAALVHEESDGLMHTDAVQTLGKIPVSQGDLGADLLSISAHKIGGPPGVGALILGGDIALEADISGGGQEMGRRSGMENLPAIEGFAAALEAVTRDTEMMDRLAQWRDGFEVELKNMVPEAVIFGADAPRLPNTTCFAVEGGVAETQVMALDLAGIEVSSGAACSSGKVSRSHVLKAMGVGDSLADGAIRLSLGWGSSRRDLVRALEAWSEHNKRVTRRKELPELRLPDRRRGPGEPIQERPVPGPRMADRRPEMRPEPRPDPRQEPRPDLRPEPRPDMRHERPGGPPPLDRPVDYRNEAKAGQRGDWYPDQRVERQGGDWPDLPTDRLSVRPGDRYKD